MPKEQYDDDDMMGDKLEAPADFDGPTHNRKCTDILCAGLLVLLWVSMTILGLQAVSGGDYRIILYPMDYDGNVCGTDFSGINMTDYPYFLYINNFGGGVCVKSCPSLAGQVEDNLTDIGTLVTYGGIFQVDGVAQLDANFVEMADYSTSQDALFCDAATCYPTDAASAWTSDGINEGNGFAYFVADSYAVISYCLLTSAASDRISLLVGANATLSGVQAGYDVWNNLYADMWTARNYIFGFGFGLSLFVAFVYIFLLRLPALLNGVVWGSIGLTIGLIVASGYYCYSMSVYWASQDPQIWSDTSITATKYVSFFLFALGAILILLLICLRKQIQLAIGCVKETGKAVHHMPIIVLVPVVQGSAFLIFTVVCGIYGIYLASQGEITSVEVPVSLSGIEITVRTYAFDDYIYYALWYLLFCFFWTSNFIVSYGDMVVSMSIAKWYFTRNKSAVLGSFTVLGSFYDTGRYHFGTLAYGSLILAIVQFLRAVLAKVQREIAKANSQVANCLLCCCQCCMWCFEQCIRFLNKNAYIQTAIFGTPFCTSARHAFFLILRNIGRIGAISYVSGAVLIIGKLFISTITAGVSYVLISQYIGEMLFSVWGPMTVIFLAAYFISDMFMDVFDMGISTILQCFIADEEMFDGEECYAEGNLKRWIEKYN